MSIPKTGTLLILLSVLLAGCTQPATTPEDDTTAAELEAAEERVTELEGEVASLEAEVAALESQVPEEEEVAPVPEIAMGVPIDPEVGYALEDMGDGLYWVTDGAYQAIFLTTGEGVILVDAPPNLAGVLPSAIENTTDEPITHVIYTHGHADHIAAAASILPEGVEILAHQGTAKTLARLQNDPTRPVPFGTFVGGAPVPMPTVTFADNHTLTVGTQTVQLDYHGPAHEAGNLFVWLPDHKVLVVIDVFFPGWVPFLGLAVAEDVPAFYAAHDQALAYDFEVLVAGHLGRTATREDVERQKEYILDVQANALTALQTVDFMEVASRTGFANAWLLFGTYLDEVAQECTRLTEAEWVGVLGGADLFTESHCAVVAESLRID